MRRRQPGLSDGERKKYFAIWNEVLVEQGWAHETGAAKDRRRYALHEQLGLPPSTKEFNVHGDDLTAWEEKTAPLRNTIYLKDNPRVKADWLADRLSQILADLLDLEKGQYEHRILVEMHDSTDLDKLPLENEGPRRTAAAKAVQPINPHGHNRDLDNHIRTLKNRLSKILSKLKADGKVRPEWIDQRTGAVAGNNRIIEALVYQKPLQQPPAPEKAPAAQPARVIPGPPQPVTEDCPF